MKLQTIAKKILQEQEDSSKASVNLSDIKIDNTDDSKDNNAKWKLQTTNNQAEYGFPGGHNAKFQIQKGQFDYVIKKGDSAILEAWEILEAAKAFAEAYNSEGYNDPIPKDFYKAMDYLLDVNEDNIKSITPDVGDNEYSLLRDKETVFLVNWPRSGMKTEWTDVPGLQDEDETAIWNRSIYVGDKNLNWLKNEQTYSISQETAVKRASTPGVIDQAAVRVMISANPKTASFPGNLSNLLGFGSGGFNADKFANVINATDGIGSLDALLSVHEIIKQVSAKNKNSSTGSHDFFFIRGGQVTRRLWDDAIRELTDLLNKEAGPNASIFQRIDIRNPDKDFYGNMRSPAESIIRSIAPYWISGDFDGSGDMKKAVRWAIMTDSMINTKAVNENGIINFIYQSPAPSFTNQVGEWPQDPTQPSTDRDKILLALLKKGIGSYNRPTNQYILPDELATDNVVKFFSDNYTLQKNIKSIDLYKITPPLSDEDDEE
jgi:hypothetical protein